MPSRRFGQAKPDVPIWRRGNAQPGPPVHLSGRQASKLAREVVAAASTTSGAHAAPGPQASRAGRGNRVLATTGAYRFRYHLVPFAWAGWVLTAGLAAHHAHATRAGVLAGFASAALIWLLTRQAGDFTRRACLAMAALTAAWVPVLTLAGWAAPLPAVAAACWLAVLAPWARHYRWRQEPPPPIDTSDLAVWERLATEKHWAGYLGTREDIPGGRRYPVILDGAKTHIGRLLSEPIAVAAAWDKPVTEAYVEPRPDGVASGGFLVLLASNSLRRVRDWDGTGIDPQTGLAVIGRYADGAPVHTQYFAPMDGVYHEILAGVTGSGKTTLLELGLCIAAASGLIVPVILDPQEGQSLPEWREHVITAEGPEACLLRLRGLHAGMLAQSRYLSRLAWRDAGGDLHKGMGFFDPGLTGLPIVEVTLDEAPALLTAAGPQDAKRATEAAWLTADMTKRARKAGCRVRLAAGVPSLAELGGERAMRSYLRGCNVGTLRVDDPGDAMFLGIPVDPAQIPAFFPDGSRTQGLGYWKGPDNRPGTPMRTDRPAQPGKVAAAARWPALGEAFAEAMEAKMRADDPPPEPLPARAAPASAPLAAVPDLPEPDDSAPEGKTAADAILTVLAEAALTADGSPAWWRGRGELTRGEVIKACGEVATRRWGRDKPFSVRGITTQLPALAKQGRVSGNGGNYRAARPALHAAGEPAGGSEGTAGQ